MKVKEYKVSPEFLYSRAKSASKGPWDFSGDPYVSFITDAEGNVIAEDCANENAAYVSIASPDTIMDMVKTCKKYEMMILWLAQKASQLSWQVTDKSELPKGCEFKDAWIKIASQIAEQQVEEYFSKI